MEDGSTLLDAASSSSTDSAHEEGLYLNLNDLPAPLTGSLVLASPVFLAPPEGLLFTLDERY